MLNTPKILYLLLLSVFLISCKTTKVAKINFRDLDSLPANERIKRIAKIIESDPHNLDAHYWFIHAHQSINLNFEGQYKIWMRNYPNVAEIPYSLGNALQETRDFKAKYYLTKAAELNPKLDQTWIRLFFEAYKENDSLAMRSYLEKGLKFNPLNAEMAYKYAMLFEEKDLVKCKSLLLKNAETFLNDEYGAKSLLVLALSTKDPSYRQMYFEKLKHTYSPEKFRNSSSGMAWYSIDLIKSDPLKAKLLIEELAGMKVKYERWGDLLSSVNQLIKINELILLNNGSEAMAQLKTFNFPSFIGDQIEILTTLKAKASYIALGVDSTYNQLVLAISKNPSFQIYKKALSYGAMIGKDSGAVYRDILHILKAKPVKATSFKLKNYASKDSLSLSHLRDNIILLTYWFPSCGPCRGEFPHFENVLRKINSTSVKYVAINMFPKEGNEVLSVKDAMNYSFIPLEEIRTREKGNLDNKGVAPVNFLIDEQGSLIFSDFRIDKDNEDDLELMLKILLYDKFQKTGR
jgi:thiol-disulfide isomerase/thioredoxin/Tfp pilus assembly protein PilF